MSIGRYLCLVILIISCTKNKFPENVIPPEKMETVFWDIIRADILVSNFTKDSLKIPVNENIALQKKIFQQHNVTKEQFYKSLDYYSKDPELMTPMLDSMVAKEGRRKIKSPLKGKIDYE